MIDEKSLLKELGKGNAISGLGLDVNTWMMLYMRLSKMINNHPKVGEWIPCSEKMPEEDGCYLVAWIPILLNQIRHYYGIFEFVDEEWQIDVPECCKNYEIEILAWMELPKPYKESDEK